MEEALVAQLLANAALAHLVRDRITWSTRPQREKLPAVVLHMISAPKDYTYEGRISLQGVLVQIDCWGGTFASVQAVKRAVVVALDTLSEPLIRAFIENERGDFEQGDGPQKDGAVDFHRASLDVRIWANQG